MSSQQSFFGDDQLKIMNKIHRVPQWAQDPKRKNTDRSLLTAKVRQYILVLGNHIKNHVPESSHAQAWTFVAERSAAKLNSECLRQLYTDIIVEDAKK